MIRRILVALFWVCALVVVPGVPAVAGCDPGSSLFDASNNCNHSADEVKGFYATSASDGYRYKLTPDCGRDAAGVGDICANPRMCAVPAGTFHYFLWRQPLAGGEWASIGGVCLGQDDLADLGVITPAMVANEFRRLDWPVAELVVQPPGGETLVNFETNFYTELTERETQTVRLLGIAVTIEATPDSYAWHFGDGTSDRTNTPGAPFPRLLVTHEFTNAHVTVHPSVDVTYRGRYRIAGGQWIDIPATRTMTGPDVPLRVIEGEPKLVG
ncbi:MAG: hypothetical protein WAW88_06060 [Nocardioides sp.]